MVRSNTENRFDSTDFSGEKNRLLPTARATPKSSQKNHLPEKIEFVQKASNSRASLGLVGKRLRKGGWIIFGVI